jgi:hypothetical protein
MLKANLIHAIANMKKDALIDVADYWNTVFFAPTARR